MTTKGPMYHLLLYTGKFLISDDSVQCPSSPSNKVLSDEPETTANPSAYDRDRVLPLKVLTYCFLARCKSYIIYSTFVAGQLVYHFGALSIPYNGRPIPAT